MSAPSTTSKIQFEQLTDLRLSEAEQLYNNSFFDGAYYLAGYALEFALKASICKLLNRVNYPNSGDVGKAYKTHKFVELILLAGLETELEDKKATNSVFNNNWNTVSGWSENKRYEPVGSTTQSTARDFLDALQDNTNGVLTWIKTKW